VKNFKIILFLAALYFAALAFPPVSYAISPAFAAIKYRKICTIIIENSYSGRIFVSAEGETRVIGEVLKPAEKLSKGFEASKYASSGRVAATAVNAIHIKVKDEVDPYIFSILPFEISLKLKEDVHSYLNVSSSIFTDVKAGSEIFGGDYAPFVGSEVMFSRDGVMFALSPGYIPRAGDMIIIPVEEPDPLLYQVVFENRINGSIWAKFYGDEWFKIGRVLKPVIGVGRFEGTEYTDIGRIRANHPGVIDISTSPLGKIGGFQIIPSFHASNVLNKSIMFQWMVVEGLGENAGIEGLPPLFASYLRPAYSDNILRRYSVDVKTEDGKWGNLPSLSGRQDYALRDVTHVRIWFPVSK